MKVITETQSRKKNDDYPFKAVQHRENRLRLNWTDYRKGRKKRLDHRKFRLRLYRRMIRLSRGRPPDGLSE